MKSLSVLVLALLVPLTLQASQRVMVIEDVTATLVSVLPGRRARNGGARLPFV